MRNDGAEGVECFGEHFALAHVFERAWVIFSGEEIVAIFEKEPFANVFVGVGIGPTDTDGFFGENDGLLILRVQVVFSEDPEELVWSEEASEERRAVDGYVWEDGGHNGFSIFDF